MHIHWFPGHMTKALRMMSDEIKAVDSVIYVLDARAPLSCINPAFEEIIGERSRLYVINKADTVAKADAEAWRDYFVARGFPCVIADSTGKKEAKLIVKKLLEINSAVIKKYADKGVKKTVRALVIGVPNCGKSTLINSLLPEKRAVTGNKPGVTKGKQIVSIDKYIDLIDSPGVLFPDFSDQKKAKNLAIIGSIKDEVTDSTELSAEIIRFMTENYLDAFCARYPVAEERDPAKILEIVAKKRGFIVKGGEVDLARASDAIIGDFRKQYFGKVILERANG